MVPSSTAGETGEEHGQPEMRVDDAQGVILP